MEVQQASVADTKAYPLVMRTAQPYEPPVWPDAIYDPATQTSIVEMGRNDSTCHVKASTNTGFFDFAKPTDADRKRDD